MDRKAFKQRMQELKSYREQNPGKGYLDWKASKYAEGGETPPTKYRDGYDKSGNIVVPVTNEDTITNVTTPQVTITPRNNISLIPSIDKGRRAFGDIGREVISNLTPFGDIESAVYTYDSFKNDDWLGVGLGLASTLPFVPMTVRDFNRYYKGIKPRTGKFRAENRPIPSVDPSRGQSAINNVLNKEQRAQDVLLKANNESYRLAERLMEDPDYIRRAGEVARKYGDDYLTTYADLLQAYDGNPNLFPKGVKDTNSKFRAQMTVKDDIRKAINKDGYVPGMGDFQYNIDTDVTDLSGNVTVHEMNHYVDFLKNKSPHADANSNMFYKMSEDMGGVRIDDDDLYYSRPTEQKAYMNQLREYMFENGDIARRGDRVSKDLLQKTLDRLKGNSKYDSVIRASKQFGNMTKYTKWFNSIPLLGIGALGVNKYFVNNEGGNYDFRQER